MRGVRRKRGAHNESDAAKRRQELGVARNETLAASFGQECRPTKARAGCGGGGFVGDMKISREQCTVRYSIVQ